MNPRSVSFAFVTAALLALASTFATLPAQCGPVGSGADLRSTPMALAGVTTLSFSGDPGSNYGLYLSLGSGPTPVPGFGTVCLDVSPSLYLGQLLGGTMPASGEVAFNFPVASDPALLNLVLFLQGATVGTGGVAATRALRVDFQAPDSAEFLPPLSVARVLHTATPTRDNRVFIAGGGSGNLFGPVGLDTTELYDPVTRTLSPGPQLALPRAFHSATELLDGRILLAGGVLGNTGIVTPTCELFDPQTGLLTTAGTMNSLRASHASIRLPDGRVLVAGGTTNFVGGGATSTGPILDSSLDTAEVYDPATDVWTPVTNTMSSRRFLPGAAMLDDGRGFIISGLSGTNLLGLPQWTASCDFYDIPSNSFYSGPAIPSPRGGAAVSVMPNGEVFVAGGAVQGLLSIPTITDSCYSFAFNAAWFPAPNLPTPVVMPSTALLHDGSLLLAGGVSGTVFLPSATPSMASYDGTNLLPLAGLPVPLGGAIAVPVADGSVLLCGGTDATSTAVTTNLIYTPNP